MLHAVNKEATHTKGCFVTCIIHTSCESHYCTIKEISQSSVCISNANLARERGAHPVFLSFIDRC